MIYSNKKYRKLVLDDIDKAILKEEIRNAIDEFYDYSYLLKEGRQLNEINARDIINKTNSLIKFAVEKTGSAVNDAANKIYVLTANNLMLKVKNLLSGSKDKKSNVALRVISKVVGYILKNPRFFVMQTRLILGLLALFGGMVTSYGASHDSSSFDHVLNNLHPMAGDHGAQGLMQPSGVHHDVILNQIDAMPPEQLKDKIANQVAQLFPDSDYHAPLIDPKAPNDDAMSHDQSVAPADIHDPAYSDLNAALDVVRKVNGDESVRRLENLIQLNRRCEELLHVGVEGKSDVILKLDSSGHIDNNFAEKFMDVVGDNSKINGEVILKKMEGSNQIIVSNFELEKNGVTLGRLTEIGYSKGDHSYTITKISGLESDVHDRMRELTKGIDDNVKDRIFNGMYKYTSWTKAYSGQGGWDHHRNVEPVAPSTRIDERMMYLAGILNEEGFLKKAKDMVSKVVGGVKGGFQKFVDGFKNKIELYIKNIGGVFMTKDNIEKISDGQPHKFEIVNGKLNIH